MHKSVYVVLFLMLFSVLYVVMYFFRGTEIRDNGELPSANSGIYTKLPAIDESGSRNKKELELPRSADVKRPIIDDHDLKRKMAKTPLSYPKDKKTVIPRLTPEEIAEAPIVDVIKMNIDNVDYDIVVVEKDGKTYDASDGVRIYVPQDFTEIRRKKGML